MRKFFSAVLAIGMVLYFCGTSSAILRQDMDAVRGILVATDPERSEVTVRDNATGEEKTFFVKKGIDPSLELGTNVILIVKKGTNVANSVRPIRQRGAQ